jgi:hypothetical protein
MHYQVGAMHAPTEQSGIDSPGDVGFSTPGRDFKDAALPAMSCVK